MDDILHQIQLIFRNFFDDSNLLIKEEMRLKDIEGWGSLELMSLIVIIEKNFNIKFTIDEIYSIDKVGVIIDLIKSKK